MKFLTIVTAAAAMWTGTALSTPAKADMNYGPATNGKLCWVYSYGGSHNEFGYWDSCPAAAATAATHRVQHHHRKS